MASINFSRHAVSLQHAVLAQTICELRAPQSLPLNVTPLDTDRSLFRFCSVISCTLSMNSISEATFPQKLAIWLQIHPSGKNILGENNLAFAHGPSHKAIRKSFLSLFTRKALSTYVQLQDGIIRRTIRQWLENPNERDISAEIRQAFWQCSPKAIFFHSICSVGRMNPAMWKFVLRGRVKAGMPHE